MIYYFSGTGNSKWAAEELARRTGDRAQSIPALLKSGVAPSLADQKNVGIVFPIYAWGAPDIVERFCRLLHPEADAYAYAVCTCGDEAGKAMRRLRRFFAWESAWSISMPGNYIIGFDADSETDQRRKISAARQKLAVIAEAVLANTHVYNVHEGSTPGIKTTLIYPMFKVAARRTKPFFVTDACNGCGLCESICPAEAIRLESGKPRWVRPACEQCLGCINRCPQAAIQYGQDTAARKRYSFREM